MKKIFFLTLNRFFDLGQKSLKIAKNTFKSPKKWPNYLVLDWHGKMRPKIYNFLWSLSVNLSILKRYRHHYQTLTSVFKTSVLNRLTFQLKFHNRKFL
jgi:hypothetical protein